MIIPIDNYTIYENNNELMFEIAYSQVKEYPFNISCVYISKNSIKQKTFYISDKDKKNILIFKNINVNNLNKLKKHKKVTFALIKNDATYEIIFELDLKIINQKIEAKL